MKICKHQQWHILILAALLGLLYFYVRKDPTALSGELWGISAVNWYIITLLSPIIHQVYVLLCWRYELHYKGLSRWWGKSAFKLYKIGFAILILSRPTTITLLAIANRNTLEIAPEMTYALSGILILPAIYLFYSVKTYFGMDRAFGIDHFYPEEYHNKPFVKQGIFKYTSNGMYIFGFLILWIPGLLFLSKAALLLALFNHVYIWVHYYFTELPDMKAIYNIHGYNLSNSN
jgi:hypothetical protein